MVVFPGGGYSLRWYYFLYISLTVAAFLIALLFAKNSFRSLYVERHLDHAASSLQSYSSDLVSAESTGLCEQLARIGFVNAAVLAADGEVICGEAGHSNPKYRDKVLALAASNERRSWSYPEPSSQVDVVQSVEISGRPLYFVGEFSTAELESRLNEVLLVLAAVILVAILSIVLLTLVLYRRIIPPLREIQAGAEKFSKGDFSRTLRHYEIREIDALSSALNKMARKLDRLDKVRRDFIANVSHELKTPITSINGFVETLLEGAFDDKDNALRFVSIVKRQSERLTRIVDDLLTLARLEDERYRDQLILQEESAKDIVSSVLEVCRPNAAQKNISLSGEVEDGVVAVVDRSLIEQALTNLVDNAIKYSKDETTVCVKAQCVDSSQVVFSVQDQGPGIPGEHLPRLFERFYRVDKARSRDMGGTGLGLAIVKHIAQVHTGSVSVDSEIGKGTRFNISLPLH